MKMKKRVYTHGRIGCAVIYYLAFKYVTNFRGMRLDFGEVVMYIYNLNLDKT